MAWCPHCNQDRPIQRQTFEDRCSFCGRGKAEGHQAECRGPVAGALDVCTYCNTPVFAKAPTQAEYETMVAEENKIVQSRARLALFLLAVLGVLGVLSLIGLATRDRSTSDLPSGPPAQAPAATSTTPTKPLDSPPPMAPEVKAARVVKEFPSYQVMGRPWRAIVVSPDNSLEALTALAKRLHAEDPKSSFEFFTDGDAQQFRRYMRYASRPTSSNPAQYLYPKAWAERHAIATLQETSMGRSDELALETHNLQRAWGQASRRIGHHCRSGVRRGKEGNLRLQRKDNAFKERHSPLRIEIQVRDERDLLLQR